MTALNAQRNTRELMDGRRQGGLAPSVVVHSGGIVMRNAAGYLTKGQTALNLIGCGRAEESKTGGAGAGDEVLDFTRGVFRYANSAADIIGITEIGKVCFVVDDQTVAKTNGTNTRSAAGFVEEVDANGVWVRFDEVLLQTYLAGIALPA